MNRLSGVVWFVLCTSIWMSCGPQVQPGLSVDIVINRGASEAWPVTRVDAIFDRKMIRPELLGGEVADAPMRIEPKVTGRWTWVEDRKLVFEADEALPVSSRFRVIIPRGTVALDGRGLIEDVSKEFETRRLRLRTTLKRDWDLPDPKTHGSLDQIVSLHFNLGVDGPAVTQYCAFKSKAGEVEPRVQAIDSQDAGSAFEVGPRESLKSDTEWSFVCSADLKGREGHLGLLVDEELRKLGDMTGAYPDGALSFQTFGPMQVVSVSPEGKDVDPDTGSVVVQFSNPPARGDGRLPISISPRPSDVRNQLSWSGNEVTLTVNGLESHTTYTVKVGAGIEDTFGQKTDKAFEVAFETGDVTPAFSLETGSWAVEKKRDAYVGWARNVASIDVRGVALTESQLFKVLPEIRWWDDKPVDLQKLKIDSIHKTLQTDGPQNKWNQVELSPSALFGGDAVAGRFYYIAAAASPEPGKEQTHQEVLLNVTNLGVTSKVASESGLVWVTNIADGVPQPGAKISIRSRAGHLLWMGRTDEQGIVRTPGLVELAAKDKTFNRRRGKSEAGADEDDDEYRYSYGYEAEYLIFAQLGDDIAFVDPERTGGFTAWNFGVEGSRARSSRQLRGFVHTDRGLYRPGDQVHIRGLARVMTLGEGLAQPERQRVELTVQDPRGTEITRKKLPLSKYGSFHLAVDTGEEAVLGDYRILVELQEGSFRAHFTVEEYRASTFGVTLDSKRKLAVTGRSLPLKVGADYFYGAPLREGKVTWRVHSRPRSVHFKGYRQFSFSNFYDSSPWGREALLTELTGELDESGRSEQQIALPPVAFKQPSTLMISATVADETHQTVSANLTLPLHVNMTYLGLDTGDSLAAAGESHGIKAVALDIHGKPIDATADLLVEKHEWNCAFERWGYKGRYRCEKKVKEIESRPISIGSNAPFETKVTLPEPGSYRFFLKGKDKRGNPVSSAGSVWCYGEGSNPWEIDDSGRFELVADKESYKVGDTAKLLVQAPLEGATGLLTIEREGVLSHRLLPGLKDGAAIDVPIEEVFAPNVYASLMLVRGREGPGSRGLPKITMGLIELKVSHKDKELKVTVETDKDDYRPGDDVRATFRVRDGDGRPVRAEVALAAADEGVLSLIGFKTPNPLGRFYADWSLGVATATAYERLQQVPEPGEERYATGGDGPGMPGTLRSRMRATAYWNPAIETNAEGEATVVFQAPDNLTAYRLMAVAADAGDRFGSGEQTFRVNKPLQILSALPRFASVGDAFDAAVMINNETGAGGTAVVALEASGVQLVGSGQRSLSLKKGGRARVVFPVLVREPGEATFAFTARMAGERDGLQSTIPLHYPTSEETATLSAGSTNGEVSVGVSLPDGVMDKTATLEISLDPDGLAGIEESLRSLIRYPYGCLEQTTSRLIALVGVQQIVQGAGFPDLDKEKIVRYVDAAVAKMGRFQKSNGGFSLWEGSDADAYLTAYALWGLKLASDAGYTVETMRMERGVDYLRSKMSARDYRLRGRSAAGEWGSRAFALFVLDELDHADNGATEDLVEKMRGMPVYGVAFLARTLARALGADHPTVGGLIGRIEEKLVLGEGKAHIEELDRLNYYMSSDARSTAIVLDMLLEVRPDHPRIRELAKWLLDRRHRRSWFSTQENVYGLTALSNYAKSAVPKQSKIAAFLDDEKLFETKLTRKGGLFHHVVELASNARKTLQLKVEEGVAHYQVSTRYRRDIAHQERRSDGLALERAFIGRDGQRIDQATEGDLVRVEVKLNSPSERFHVALSHYLPAGLEPINTSFVTSAQGLGATGGSDQWRRRWTTHRDLRDERIDAFWEFVYRGDYYVEFVTRATTAGTFVLPAATAEEMYDPQVSARTGVGVFKILARP